MCFYSCWLYPFLKLGGNLHLFTQWFEVGPHFLNYSFFNFKNKVFLKIYLFFKIKTKALPDVFWSHDGSPGTLTSGIWLHLVGGGGPQSLGAGSAGASGNPGHLFHMKIKKKQITNIWKVFPQLFLEFKWCFYPFPSDLENVCTSRQKGLCGQPFISSGCFSPVATSLPRELRRRPRELGVALQQKDERRWASSPLPPKQT